MTDNKPKPNIEFLDLKLFLEKTEFRMGEKIKIQVILSNKGTTSVSVNSRLSMGYPDTDERDLYCEIFQQAGRKYLDYQNFQVDYRSQQLSSKFVQVLKPEEALDATFDLQEWYRINQPGEYMIKVIYEPEQSLNIPHIVSGSISSPLKTITLH